MEYTELCARKQGGGHGDTDTTFPDHRRAEASDEGAISQRITTTSESGFMQELGNDVTPFS
jgi:hypothetical protein